MFKVLRDDWSDELFNLVFVQGRSDGLELAVVLGVRIIVGVMRVILRLFHSNQFTARDSPGTFASCSS